MKFKNLSINKGILWAFVSTALGALITILYKPMMMQGVSAISLYMVESLAIVMALFAFAKPWRLFSINKRVLYPIFICSFCQAIGNTCFYFGLSYLDPVTFNFLTRNQAVFSVIFGFFFLSERHNLATWMFIAFAVVGSLLLCYGDINPMNLVGVLFALSYCFCFGVRNFILRKYQRTPALINIFYGYALSILFLLILCSLKGMYTFDSFDLGLNLDQIIRICVVAIVASFGTIYTFQIALRHEAVSIISPVRLFSPFIVAVYFGITVGFDYSSTKLLGMTIMTLAILSLVYSSRQKYRAMRALKLQAG